MKVDYIIKALNVIKEDEELDIKNLKNYKNELLVKMSSIQGEITLLDDKISNYQHIKKMKNNPKNKLFASLLLTTIIITILSFMIPNIFIMLSTILSTIISVSVVIQEVDIINRDNNSFFEDLLYLIKELVKSNEEIDDKIKELEKIVEIKASELDDIKNIFSSNDTKLEEKQDELSFIDGMIDSMDWLINHQNVVDLNDNTIAVNFVKKRVLNI